MGREIVRPVPVDERAIRKKVSENKPNWEDLPDDYFNDTVAGTAVEPPEDDPAGVGYTPPGAASGGVAAAATDVKPESGGTISTSGAPDTPKPRKRKEAKDYGGIFLCTRVPVLKRPTYISAALFQKITEITAVIANDVTLPTFLDNVLEHHLETYRDEINDLYESKTKKPL
jgi:hypothetical protein